MMFRGEAAVAVAAAVAVGNDAKQLPLDNVSTSADSRAAAADSCRCDGRTGLVRWTEGKELPWAALTAAVVLVWQESVSLFSTELATDKKSIYYFMECLCVLCHVLLNALLLQLD
eukprot:scaffold158568_cov50-Attheya_sp.AAC.3